MDQQGNSGEARCQAPPPDLSFSESGSAANPNSMDSSSSVGPTSGPAMMNRSLRRLRIWRAGLLNAYRLRKPTLLREFLYLSGAAIVGSTLLITLLYIFFFVLSPQGANDLGFEDFISGGPKTADGLPVDGLKRWTEDFSRSAIPIMCHSHNDYWRHYPLYSALAAGCTGVEADVFLSDDGSDLLVGHDRHSLSPNRTLRSLYLDPLLDILNIMNPPDQWSNFSRTDRAQGVFRSQPNVTLVLLLDVKDNAAKTWPVVMQQLQPLREKLFLTRFEIVEISPGFELRQHDWPGPVTIVGTGNIVANRKVHNWPDDIAYRYYHDSFLDAPLGNLPQDNVKEEWDSGWSASVIWDKDDAYYTSVSFQQSIGSVRTGFSEKQLAKLRRQIETAKWSGLKTRYWDLPSWPISYRDYVWEVLTREQVDMLNVDDLRSAAKRSWTTGYIRNVIWMILTSVFIFLTSVTLTWFGYKAVKKHMDALMTSQPIRLE